MSLGASTHKTPVVRERNPIVCTKACSITSAPLVLWWQVQLSPDHAPVPIEISTSSLLCYDDLLEQIAMAASTKASRLRVLIGETPRQMRDVGDPATALNSVLDAACVAVLVMATE